MLIPCGIDSFVFVIGPNEMRLRNTIHLAALELDVRCQFLVQQEPAGIGSALALGREIAQSRFVVLMGDTWFHPSGLDEAIERFSVADAAAFLSVRREDDLGIIESECSVSLDGDRVTAIVEKPNRDTLSDNIKACGVYMFSQEIFDAIDRTPVSPLRNELELTNAISGLAGSGEQVLAAFTMKNDVNISTPEDLLRANMFEIERLGVPNVIGKDVVLGEGARIENSVIGDSCRIEGGVSITGSVLFPNSTVNIGASLTGQLVGPSSSEE